MSLHSKRQQQHLLPGKHKAKEEKEAQCIALQSKEQCSAESKSRDRIALATPPTRQQQQCTKGQSRCCCPRPPFNLGLRAAHIRGKPCNPPPSHLLAVSSLAHNFPPAVPLSQILLISTLQHPTPPGPRVLAIQLPCMTTPALKH